MTRLQLLEEAHLVGELEDLDAELEEPQQDLLQHVLAAVLRRREDRLQVQQLRVLEVVRDDDEEAGAGVDGRPSGRRARGCTGGVVRRRRLVVVAVLLLRVLEAVDSAVARQTLQLRVLLQRVRRLVRGDGDAARRPLVSPPARQRDVTQVHRLEEDEVADVLLEQQEQRVQQTGSDDQWPQPRDIALAVGKAASGEERLRVAGTADAAQSPDAEVGALAVALAEGGGTAVVLRTVLELDAVLLHVAPEVRHGRDGLATAAAVRTL